MRLIVVIVCTLIDRELPTLCAWRRFEWFRAWLRACRRWLADPAGAVGLAVFAPALALWGAGAGVAAVASPLGWLLAAAVLLYCLGPRELLHDIDECLAAIRSDDREALVRAAGNLGVQGADMAEPELVSELVWRTLVQANERLFAVILWFVLAGPAGALAWRLASIARNELAAGDPVAGRAAAAVHGVLQWLPARAVAMSYALSGSLPHALARWRFTHTLHIEDNELALVEAGIGALTPFDEDDLAGELAMVRDLVVRSFWLWLTALALATLGGWLV